MLESSEQRLINIFRNRWTKFRPEHLHFIVDYCYCYIRLSISHAFISCIPLCSILFYTQRVLIYSHLWLAIKNSYCCSHRPVPIYISFNYSTELLGSCTFGDRYLNKGLLLCVGWISMCCQFLRLTTEYLELNLGNEIVNLIDNALFGSTL